MTSFCLVPIFATLVANHLVQNWTRAGIMSFSMTVIADHLTEVLSDGHIGIVLQQVKDMGH